MEFTALKTKVNLSPVFFMVLTVFFLIDKQGIALPAIMISLCHEVGHFCALLCTKTIPLFVNLLPFGIQMELPHNLSTGKKVFVLISGFTVNFVICAIFFAFGKSLYGYISLFIGIFTALPMSSTDGGGVLAAILEEFSPENAEVIFCNITLVFSYFAAFLLCTAAFFTKNIFLAVPITYILIMALKK